MSADLVARLRNYVDDCEDVPLRMQAADEIERLRSLVHDAFLTLANINSEPQSLVLQRLSAEVRRNGNAPKAPLP